MNEEEQDEIFNEAVNRFLDQKWNERFQHPDIIPLQKQADQMEERAEQASARGDADARALADQWWEFSERVADRAEKLYFEADYAHQAEVYAEGVVQRYLKENR